MQKKVSDTRAAKGKARERQDAETAERIKAILSDPKTRAGVKTETRRLVNELGETTTAGFEETPDWYAGAFREAAQLVRTGRFSSKFAEEVADIYANLTRLAEQREPQEHRVARRCVEIFNEWLGRKKGRQYPDGATYFAQHVDAVLECGEGVLISINSEYFTPFFVKAAREAREGAGSYRRHYRRLLDLIKRVDGGADLNQLHDEGKRRQREQDEQQEAAILNAREPQDKTSDEWRYWKIRQIGAGFQSEDLEQYGAAWREFFALVDGFRRDENQQHVSHARALLPSLLVARQDSERMRRRTARERAKVKTAKKGGAR